jgi:osmotically-inducible protein OsmY
MTKRPAPPASWKPLCAAALLVAGTVLLQGCIEAALIGAATGTAMAATDRRQPEVIIGDKRIEYSGSNRIGNVWGDKAHINISSFNYTVLLTGEAPTPEAKAEIEKIAAEVPQVRNVVNEIEIGPRSSGASRSSDGFITSKVKGNLFSQAEGRFLPDSVKVVTERGITYLMGLVTRQEAEDITEIARTTSGVKKVVRIFEYIQPPLLKREPAAAPPPTPG